MGDNIDSTAKAKGDLRLRLEPHQGVEPVGRKNIRTDCTRTHRKTEIQKNKARQRPRRCERDPLRRLHSRGFRVCRLGHAAANKEKKEKNV